MIITAYDSDFYELCAYGTAQEVREAIKAGANVNAGENFTPLMNAIKCRNIRVIKTLIDAGVDVNAKDIIGCSALNMALQHDDIKIMNILIKAGADVNNKDKEGYTVLIRAVHYNNIDAVNVLLGAGADVNVKNNIGETALTSAMQYGTNLQIIRTLLKAGADVNVQNEYGKTALMKIISKIDEDDDHLDVIKTLIEAGADINVKDNNGMTALMSAVYEGKEEVVNFLLKAGANINIKDNCDRTALIIAFTAYIFRNNIVDMLLKAGADVNDKALIGNDKCYWSLLMWAAWNGNKKFVKRLIEAGSDVNIRDEYGRTPLMAASWSYRIEIMNMLLENGADINMKDNTGRKALDRKIISDEEFNKFCENRPVQDIVEAINSGCNVNLKDKNSETLLMKAVWRNDIDIVAVLIKAGADVNSRDNRGNTALMYTYSNNNKPNNIEIIALLLKAGADINAKNDFGETALTNAAKFCLNSDVIIALLKAGADVNVKDKYARTPLMGASWFGTPEIITALLKAGADINAKDDFGRIANYIAHRKRRISDRFHISDEAIKILDNAVCNVELNNEKIKLSSDLVRIEEHEHRWARVSHHYEALDKFYSTKDDIKKEQSKLFDAIKCNDLKTVKSLLEKGFNVNACNSKGESALTCAINMSSLEIIKILLEYKAEVEYYHILLLVRDEIKNNSEKAEIMKLLLPVCDVTYGAKALIAAYQNYDSENVKLLIDYVTNAGLLDKWCQVAFMFAVTYPTFDIINFVLSIYQPDSKILDKAFGEVIKSDNIRMAERLLYMGANVNAYSYYGEERFFISGPAISVAAGKGYIEMIKMLLKYGADSNSKNINGTTALMFAAQLSCQRATEILLKHGADVNTTNEFGDTALSFALDDFVCDVRAMKQNTRETVRLLLRAGANTNVNVVIDNNSAFDIIERLFYDDLEIMNLAVKNFSTSVENVIKI